MKRELIKLEKLANKIHQFAIRIGLNNDGFKDYNEEQKDYKLRIYLSDNAKTCAIYFGDVQVKLYSKSFDLPFYIDAKRLNYLHEYFNNYLNNELSEIENALLSIEKDEVKRKLKKIEKLEIELKKLKDEVD